MLAKWPLFLGQPLAGHTVGTSHGLEDCESSRKRGQATSPEMLCITLRSSIRPPLLSMETWSCSPGFAAALPAYWASKTEEGPRLESFMHMEIQTSYRVCNLLCFRVHQWTYVWYVLSCMYASSHRNSLRTLPVKADWDRRRIAYQCACALVARVPGFSRPRPLNLKWYKAAGVVSLRDSSALLSFARLSTYIILRIVCAEWHLCIKGPHLR